jgi:AcrR family transcriptional regulator
MKYSEKQVQIIETAEQLFAVHGYEGTSVRQIADAAGVNLAMISYYFGSKEKLMQALVNLRTVDTKLAMQSLLKDDAIDPFQKMNIMISQYVERLIQQQRFFKIMVSEQMLHKNCEISDMLTEVKKGNAALLEEIVKEGQKKKYFKKNIDVVMLMNILIGTITQTLINIPFYKAYHKLESLSEETFNDQLAKKITEQLKIMFKGILSYEK